MDMRIGLVGPLPPPAGGMANQTRQLGELLAGNGAVVELVQTNARYRPAWVAGIRGLRALFRLLPFTVRLWRCAGRVDLVHVMANSGWAWHLFAAPAIWIARMRGVPVVVNYRGGAAEEFLRRSAGAVRVTMRIADRLVVPSRFLVEVFGRHGMRAEVVPNVVDLNRFSAAGPGGRKRAGPPHLIVTRNLEAIYDVETALRAFHRVLERHPEARMTVAGTGPERPKLERIARDLGMAERVRFAGRLEGDAIVALYRSAHILVNPSRVDNTPNSILEALASEVPVVSTDAGGIPYLVRHRETALFVPVADPEAMAKAVIELLEHPDVAEDLVAAGRILSQQFAWSSVGPVLLALYRDLISGGAATRAAHAE